MSYCKNVSYVNELCNLEFKTVLGPMSYCKNVGWHRKTHCSVISGLTDTSQQHLLQLFILWQQLQENFRMILGYGQYSWSLGWSLCNLLKKSLCKLSFNRELKPILEPRLYSLNISDHILCFSYCNFHPGIKSRLHYLCWVIFRTQAAS